MSFDKIFDLTAGVYFNFYNNPPTNYSYGPSSGAQEYAIEPQPLFLFHVHARAVSACHLAVCLRVVLEAESNVQLVLFRVDGFYYW